MDKKTIVTVACVGVVAGVAIYGVYRYFNRPKEMSQWDIYTEMKDGYDGGVDRTGLDGIPVEPMEEEEIAENVEPSEIPLEYKVVSDEKPDIDELLNEIKERSRKIGEEREETVDESVEEADVQKGDVGKVEETDSTYNVDDIEFDENGLPVFSEKDWEAEESDNITLISQGEYLDFFQDHEKEQAVWFTKSNVLVNTELTPIDVVDTVGPTAFTTLCKNPDITVFVKNEELKTDYELFMNDSCTIETAWEEQGA